MAISKTSQLFIFYISNKYLFYLSLEIIQDDLPVVFGDFKEDLGFLGIKESKNKQKTLTLTTFTCFLQLCRWQGHQYPVKFAEQLVMLLRAYEGNSIGCHPEPSGKSAWGLQGVCGSKALSALVDLVINCQSNLYTGQEVPWYKNEWTNGTRIPFGRPYYL